MFYLEDYIEKIGALPIDINRGLKLIKDLDEKHQNMSARLTELQEEYLTRIRNAKDKKRELEKADVRDLMEEIRQLEEECLTLSKSKIDTATQSYDAVDRHIGKLDKELKKFEDELKVQTTELHNLQSEKKMMKLSKLEIKQNKKSEIKLKTAERNMIIKALENAKEVLDPAETPLDSSEPRYCKCNGVSYGDMVKCDNTFCEKEWFHFGCVGLTTKPKGKWFCHDCKLLKSKSMVQFE